MKNNNYNNGKKKLFAENGLVLMQFPLILFCVQISDDEDETHPNIDTPSLFRWRHQARVERMEEQEREKRDFDRNKTE